MLENNMFSKAKNKTNHKEYCILVTKVDSHGGID